MQRDVSDLTVASVPAAKTVIEVPNEGGPYTFRPSDIRALSPEARRSLAATIRRLPFKRAPALPFSNADGYFLAARERAETIIHGTRKSTYVGTWGNGARFEVSQCDTPASKLLKASRADVRRSRVWDAERHVAYLESLKAHAFERGRAAPWTEADNAISRAKGRASTLTGELNSALWAAESDGLPTAGALALYDPAFAASQVAPRPSVAVAPVKPPKADKRLAWLRLAVSTDDTRMNLQGLLTLPGGQVAACDGSRIHYIQPVAGFALSPDAMPETGPASHRETAAQYADVIASTLKAVDAEVCADADEWAAALKASNATKREPRKDTYVAVESGAFGVRLRSGDSAIVVTACPAPVTRLRGVSAVYLAQAIKGARGPVILAVKGSDSRDPLMVKRLDGCSAVIMPMSLSAAHEREAKLATVDGAESELFEAIEALEAAHGRKVKPHHYQSLEACIAEKAKGIDTAEARVNAAQSALAALRPARPYVPPALAALAALAALGCIADTSPVPHAAEETTEPVTVRLPVYAPKAGDEHRLQLRGYRPETQTVELLAPIPNGWTVSVRSGGLLSVPSGDLTAETLIPPAVYPSAPPRRPVPVAMVPVTSSNLAAIGYDTAARVLTVSFRNGSAYEYNHVESETHAALMAAESHGSYLARAIKAHPDRYPCRQTREADAKPQPSAENLRAQIRAEQLRQIEALKAENARLTARIAKRDAKRAARQQVAA